MNNTIHCVYRIVCFPTGKVYIGQTHRISRRRSEHFDKLKRGVHHNKHLQRAWNKYGRENFFFEVLENGIPTHLINEREEYWIAHFNSFKNGFNKSSGGGYKEHNTKSCVWNGIKYPSVKVAAEALGVRPMCMGHRIRKGYVCDDDLRRKPNNDPRRKVVVWNGVEYPSINAASKACGVRKRTMSRRIANGLYSDDDVSTGYTLKRGKPVFWNGIQYLSINSAARACGIAKCSMRERLKNGYTCDQDMSQRNNKPGIKNGAWR